MKICHQNASEAQDEGVHQIIRGKKKTFIVAIKSKEINFCVLKAKFLSVAVRRKHLLLQHLGVASSRTLESRVETLSFQPNTSPWLLWPIQQNTESITQCPCEEQSRTVTPTPQPAPTFLRPNNQLGFSLMVKQPFELNPEVKRHDDPHVLARSV